MTAETALISVAMVAVMGVIGACAWDYASGTKRRERAQRRREEGDKVVARILGK